MELTLDQVIVFQAYGYELRHCISRMEVNLIHSKWEALEKKIGRQVEPHEIDMAVLKAEERVLK